MTSYKKRLLLILISVVLINFLLVFFSFNLLIGQYIRHQAEKELFTSINSVEASKSSGAVEGTLAVPAVPAEPIPQGEDVSNITQAVPVSNSIINTNCIILNKKNEVVFPSPVFLPNDRKNTVEYLSNYYIDNSGKFQKNTLVKIISNKNTYFTSLISIASTDAGESYTVLLYTDITPVENFTDTVNYVLLLILIISGVVTVLIGIHMYGGINKAIKSLCDYAEQIGHGRFNAEQKQYSYEEFNRLAHSMNDMSQKLEKYDSKQKKFFQNISHELRTPLMSIQGYAEGIQHNVFDNNSEAAGIIASESEKMSSLIDQLLYMSRMDSGLLELNIHTLDIRDLLANCIDSIKIIAQKEKKTVTGIYPESVLTIEADEELLSRAILNILANGIRHAHSNVEVACTAVDDGVRIDVTDDGKGIAEKDIPHIFERFYMGENGKSGLGLAITKEIIERHNGRITAENTDTGARFTIRLITKKLVQ